MMGLERVLARLHSAVPAGGRHSPPVGTAVAPTGLWRTLAALYATAGRVAY